MLNPRFSSSSVILAVGIIATSLAAFVSTTLPAQDVILTPPLSFKALPNDKSYTSEIVPQKVKTQDFPAYPADLLKSSETGYVIAVSFRDANGTLRFFRPYGSNASFEDSVRNAYFKLPAFTVKLNGKPYPSLSWGGIIFNPQTAAANNPNATIRLLKVAPIMVKGNLWDALPADNKTLAGTLEIDAKGLLQKFTLDSQEPYAHAIKPDIEKSLSQWAFAPARANKQPISSTLKIKFAIQPYPDATHQISPNIIVPVAINKVPPKFPQRWLQAGHSGGGASMAFDVTTEGNVENIQTVSATSSQYELAVIEALKQWKFTPGSIDGHPTKMHMLMPMIFDVEESVDD